MGLDSWQDLQGRRRCESCHRAGARIRRVRSVFRAVSKGPVGLVISGEAELGKTSQLEFLERLTF